MLKQLIDNAIDAMSLGHIEQRELCIATQVSNGMARIDIIDSGPGIPADLAVKVFEPFFSTKPATSGCRGMGLPMVHEVVVQHHGSVHIDLATRHGCHIVVELPISGPRSL